MIDAPIQEAIKILNDNGRKTMYCCAGHYRGSGELCEIQVVFTSFTDSAPKGWKKNYERGIVYFDFRPKDKEEFRTIQEREINKLIEWGKEK